MPEQIVMPRNLKRQIEMDLKMHIPREYLAAGYHFCPDWDGMLVGPTDAEWDNCLCNEIKQNTKETL